VVLLLESGTWARPLTQSPELGFGLLFFPSWSDFDFVLPLLLRSCRHWHSIAVVQGLVHFSAHPQMMQQHRQLSGRSHNRSLLCVSSTTLGQFQSPTPQITVDAEWSQNVLRPLHQQRPQIRIALMCRDTFDGAVSTACSLTSTQVFGTLPMTV
jgi:hypothetical protein